MKHTITLMEIIDFCVLWIMQLHTITKLNKGLVAVSLSKCRNIAYCAFTFIVAIITLNTEKQ